MSPGLRSMKLDDDSLVRIFSKVRLARELARFALVCKRWRDLSYSVSHLSFELEAATKNELRTQEGIVSGVLCRASSRAPGQLKDLRVSFVFREEPAEVHGHWLLWTTSLTKLELISFPWSLEWGAVIWNSIVRMKTLEAVTIKGNCSTQKHLLLPQVLVNGLQMARLQYCNISNDKVSVAMLETIFATCPALTELRVLSDNRLAEPLRVASNSLEIFSMILVNRDGFEVTVHAPRLTTLKLHSVSGPISIYFESAQSLRTISFENPCKLYNPPENLRVLKLSGKFDLQQLQEMLMLTSMITDLYLDGIHVEGEGKIDIDHILAPLVNLRNLYCYYGVMSHFRAGERRYEALNVHLEPFYVSAPEVCLLKALIEAHKIQSLVVDMTFMVDCQTKAISEEWRLLCELSDFYPDRVKFVR